MRLTPNGDAWWLAVLAAQKTAEEMGLTAEEYAAVVQVVDRTKSGARSAWPDGFC